MMIRFFMTFIFLTSLNFCGNCHLPFLNDEGFAANAFGGQSGKMIYVTILEPSGSGSLTEALQTNGQRHILFKACGHIPANV